MKRKINLSYNKNDNKISITKVEKDMNICVKAFEIMKIIEEHDDYNPNDVVTIESRTYYKLEFLTNNWILRR